MDRTPTGSGPGNGGVEPVQPDAPVLRGPVLMNQDWRDLLYLHWAVPPERVAVMMPPGVRPDVFGPTGATYVGFVPFRMVDAGLGRRSSVPWLGTFLETNVRLYSVDARGRRGVVFLSLDANRLAVVLGARAGFALPYRWAAMSHEHEHEHDPEPGGRHRWTSRVRAGWGVGTSDVEVRVGAPREPTALDHFVSARWRLHTRVLGRTRLVPNHHGRWPLADVEVVRADVGSLLTGVGLAELAGRAPDHTGFSTGVHTEFGLPRRADRA